MVLMHSSLAWPSPHFQSLHLCPTCPFSYLPAASPPDPSSLEAAHCGLPMILGLQRQVSHPWPGDGLALRDLLALLPAWPCLESSRSPCSNHC